MIVLSTDFGTSNSDLTDIPYRLVEDSLQTSLCESRTLDVFDGPNLLFDLICSLERDGLHLLLSQALLRHRIISKIELCTDENNGDIGRMVFDLGVPLSEM